MAEGADRADALLLWRRASKDRHTPSGTQGPDRTGAFLPGQTGRTELTGWVMKTKQIAQTREMLEKEGKGMPEESRQDFPTRTSMLFYFLKGSKRYFVLCVLFSMCVSFLDLVNPKLIGYTVDSVIGNEAALLPSYAAWLLQFLFGSTENIHGRVGQMVLLSLLPSAVCAGTSRIFSTPSGPSHWFCACGTFFSITHCTFRLRGTTKITRETSFSAVLRMWRPCAPSFPSSSCSCSASLS